VSQLQRKKQNPVEAIKMDVNPVMAILKLGIGMRKYCGRIICAFTEPLFA